jgi:hypothetical protein
MTGLVRSLAPLVLGVLALVVAALIGGTEIAQRLVVSPPPFVRLCLGVAAAILGASLVLRAGERLGGAVAPRELVRAVRLVFLAVAAFAAAAGWFLGSALPIVAALVIAGIDVIETWFLMLVTAVRSDRERIDPEPDADISR